VSVYVCVREGGSVREGVCEEGSECEGVSV
jgi:hypothetical protein